MTKRILAAALVLTASLSFAEEIVTDSKGRKIILHDDFTWEVQQAEARGSGEILVLTKGPKLTRVLKTRTGKVTINYDANVWRQAADTNASAEFSFQNMDNNGFGMLIYDGLPIPLATMEEVVIKNANNIDPNASIKDIEKCMVNGTPGELITYQARSTGLDFTFFSFVATKDTGTIQYTFYTLTSVFDKLRPSFLEALSGVEF